MDMNNEHAARRSRLVYAAFALITAILYDVFFWQQEKGLGFLIFVVIYAVGFVLLTLATKKFRQPLALLLLIPTLVMSVDVVLFNNNLVHNLIPLVVIILLIIFSVLVTLQNLHTVPFAFSRIPLLKSIDLPFLQWSTVLRDLFRWGKSARGDVYKKIAWGIIISFPILLIFGSLFASADSAFADLLGRIFHIDIEPTTIWRIIRTGAITLFLSSLLYVLIGDEHTLKPGEMKALRPDAIVVGTILTLVNALFLAFVMLQLQTLHIADAARSGFFQLAWVIALTAGMLMLFYNAKSQGRSGYLLTALKLLLIVQVGVIAYFAVRRMYLFQDLGYSVMRLYVEWFIYLILLILAVTAVSLLRHWPFRSLFYTSIILGLTALATVSSVNVDKMVGAENVRRLLEGNTHFHFAYLDALSVDAALDIVLLLGVGRLDPETRKQVLATVKKFEAKTIQYNDWREFNFGVQKAKESLGNSL